MTTQTQVPLTVMDNHDPAMLRELVDAVEDVARSGAFIGGPFVESFETALAASCQTASRRRRVFGDRGTHVDHARA